MVRTAARARAVRTVRPSRTVGACRALNDRAARRLEAIRFAPIGRECTTRSRATAASPRAWRVSRCSRIPSHLHTCPKLHRSPLRASLSGCSWAGPAPPARPDAGADEAFHEELAGPGRAREVVAPPRRGIPGGQRRSVRAKRPPRRPHAPPQPKSETPQKNCHRPLAHRAGNVVLIELPPDPRVVDEQFGMQGEPGRLHLPGLPLVIRRERGYAYVAYVVDQ